MQRGESLRIAGVTLILIAILGCSKREPVVAIGRIGGAVTLKEFEDEFSRGKSADVLQSVEIGRMRDFLGGMVDRRLKLRAAYRAGMDEDSTVLKRFDPFYRQQLIQQLYRTEIVEPTIKESQIRDFYARTGKEVSIRKILIRAPMGSSDSVLEKKRSQAEELLMKIRSGEAFEEVARQSSEDKNSAQRGGLLDAWTWTRSNDPLMNAAFSMEIGEVSEPIKNHQGFNIIKLIDVKNKERKPYRAARQEILQTLEREKRELLTKNAELYLNKLKEKKKYVWSDSTIALIAEKMASVGDRSRDQVVHVLENLGLEPAWTPLLTFKNGEFTVQDLIELIRTFPERQMFNVDRVEVVRNIVDRRVTENMLLENARRKHLNRHPALADKLKDRLENEMIAVFTEKHIIGDVDTDVEQLKAFYEKHKEEKYAEPGKVKVQEVMVKDPDLAQRVADRAQSGERFDRLVQNFTERIGYKEKNGIIDYFTRDGWGIIGEKAFEMRVGEIAGPLQLGQKRGYSIIKLLDRQERRIKPFMEVEPALKRDYVKAVKDERETCWLSEQRTLSRVFMFEETLEMAFSDQP